MHNDMQDCHSSRTLIILTEEQHSNRTTENQNHTFMFCEVPLVPNGTIIEENIYFILRNNNLVCLTLARGISIIVFFTAKSETNVVSTKCI